VCLLRGTFCPHSVFMCFVWIWEQTAIISLHSIHWLVFITEMECVYCAVRAECVNIIELISKGGLWLPNQHLVLQKLLIWYSISRCSAWLSCILPSLISKFSHTRNHVINKIWSCWCDPNRKLRSKLQSLCCTPQTQQSTSHHLLCFPTLSTLPPVYTFQKNKRAVSGNFQRIKFCVYAVAWINAVPFITCPPVFSPLCLALIHPSTC
jgi:hypothetical protein